MISLRHFVSLCHFFFCLFVSLRNFFKFCLCMFEYKRFYFVVLHLGLFFFCFKTQLLKNILFLQPQDKKNSQLAKVKAWEAEFARKCQPLTMKIVGPVWPRQRANSSSPASAAGSCNQSVDEVFLSQFAAVSLVPLPIAHPMVTKGEASSEMSADNTPVPGKDGTGDNAGMRGWGGLPSS